MRKARKDSGPEESDELFKCIHQLVTRQIEYPQDAENAQALEQLLIDTPAARQIYLGYIQETVQIASRLEHDDQGDENADILHLLSSVGTSRRNLSFSALAIFSALAVSLVLLAGWFWMGSAPQFNAPSNVAPYNSIVSNHDGHSPSGSSTMGVATLTNPDGMVWEQSTNQVNELDRISIGQSLNLTAGRFKLIFDSGVEALVIAPCGLRITGENRVHCDYGQISAIVSDERDGFVVETPNAVVTDLGTEFGISISRTGTTEVAVFEGEVRVEFGAKTSNESRPYEKWEHLSQGEATLVDANGNSRRVFSIDDQQLPSVHGESPVRKRPAVIESVRDNVNERMPKSRKFYRIIHAGFREDCQAFVDRPHQWNGLTKDGIPSELHGADYVMPFNDDKSEDDLEVTVTIRHPAVIYILFCTNTEVPRWLSDHFTKTELQIGLDEGLTRYKSVATATGAGKSIDSPFEIWKREVPVPREFTLGSFRRPDNVRLGFNMYGIVAVAMDEKERTSLEIP